VWVFNRSYTLSYKSTYSFFFLFLLSHWHDHPLPHRSQVLFGDLTGHTGKFFKESSNDTIAVDQTQSVIDPWVQ
jgi:hypothetical protein